ncbi:MAG: gliding motility-associated C-terminal domain-containing protein [Flavobacteriales bacterium]
MPTAETDVVLQSTRDGSVEVSITGAAVCHSLSISDQAVAFVQPSGTLSLTDVDVPGRVINGGAVVLQSPPAPGMRSTMTGGPGLWYAPDALAGDDLTPLSLMDTDCATGGADPYNIDIQIQNDYNGQAISCNTAADGALTVNVTGGVGPFSFQWVGGSLPPTFTQSINGLAAGTYTVLVTDLGQSTICSETIVLSAPPAITLLDFTPNPPSCTSLCDGSATVLAIGGTGTLDYNWSNGETGQVATMLCNGNNTLTVTDANDCVYTTNIALALDTLYANITVNNILCGGEPDGSAEANPVGGDGGPYTINWSNGDSGPIMSDEFAGIYSATILDGNGCQVDTTFEILEEPPLVLTLDNTTEPSCGGSTDGAIFVSVTGGLPPYDTDWTGPGGFTSTSEDLIAVGAGAYTLTVTDANGCEQVLGVVLDEPDAVDATAVVTPLSCAGAADGAIDLTPSGGAAPYDFVWTALPFFTAFTEDISGLEAGTYNVLITDQIGCFTLLSFDLTEPDPMQLDLAVTPITCTGADDGEIDLTITGGTPGYTVSWDLDGSGTSASEDLTGLTAGTYTVTVTDANDCVETASVTLDDPVAIDLSAVATPVSCIGDTDGAIDLTVSGGTPTIDLDWTGPGGFTSTSEDLSGLEPGTYTVTATDAGGCVQTLDVTIDEPLEITVDATTTPLACADDTSGAIDVDISGGTAPYDTDWTGPGGFTSTEEDLTGLAAGTYTLTVTDANDCQVTVDVEVTAPDPIDVVADITDILCSGDDSGAIDLTITGGTPGYDTDWVLQGGGTSTSEDLTGLAAGDYEVTVTDGAGCQVVINYTVDENPPFDLTETITPLSCAGAADGAIALTLVGGSLPFDFGWSGPGGFTAATQDIFGLEAGPYDVDITDALGCTESYSFMVTEPDAIVLSADITDTSCGNTNDGEIDLTITAGVAPLDIDWTGPGEFTASSEDLTGLEAGTYDVTVTDADGCQQTSSFDVLPGAVLDITSATGNVSCFGAMDGFIDLTISGGNPPIDVVWTLPGGGTVNSEDLTGLGPGTYDVTVSDVDGCAVDLSFDITEPFELLVSGDPTPITCNSTDDGAVDLTVAGGEAPYDIAWTGPGGFTATTEDIMDLEPGTYEVTVTDNLGCQQVLSFDLSEPGSINLFAFALPVSCAGEADGSIDLTVFGGTPDFTFDWTGPDGFTADTEDIAGLAAGTYTVEVTDANGCTQSQDYDISEPTPIDTTMDVTDITCFGPGSGAIDLTVTGGQGPYTVTWTFPDTSTQVSEDLTGLDAGDYEALIEDASGCTVTILATVNETPPFDVTINVTDATCAGLDDGAIELIISGGVGPYDVNWGFTTGPTITGLAAGAYNANITDALGCTQELNGIMVEEAAPIVVDVTHTNETCPGAADGTIDILSITGGTDPITVSWTGPGGFTSADNTLTGLEAGTYDLLVEDANGCQATQSIEVLAATPLVLTPTVTDPPCGGVSEISLDLDGGNGWPTDAGGAPITDWLVEWTADNGFALTENVVNNSTITNLEAGTYTVTVTDFNGCSQTLNFDIQNAQALDVQSVVIQPGCGDADDGSIELAISGGTAPIDVLWTADNGFASTDEDIFGLGAGTYVVEVADALGCFYSESFEVAQPDELLVELTAEDVLCADSEDGAIQTTVTGGVGPYAFTWIGPNGFTDSAQNPVDLAPDCYEVTVTDANGCAATAEVCIGAPAALELTATLTHILCAGDSTGSIDWVPSGGVGGFVGTWTGPLADLDNLSPLDSLIAGEYTLALVDANGCPLDTTFTIAEPAPIALTANTTSPLCVGEANGTIDATLEGGTPDYTIGWTGPDGFSADTQDISDLAAGWYTYTITDDAGCVVTDSLELADPLPLSAEAVVDSISCFGFEDAAIDLTPTGGMEPYGFAWNGPDGFTANTEDIADLAPGTYEVLITDLAGCTGTLTFDLLEPTELVVTLTGTSPASCPEAEDGSATLQISGGTPDYNVVWSGPLGYTSLEQNPTDLMGGQYAVTVEDANGCQTALQPIDIETLGGVEADAGADLTACEETGPWTLSGTNTGGSSEGWYDADGVQINTSSSLEIQPEPGVYEFIYIADDGLCSDADTVVVEILPSPLADAGADMDVYLEEVVELGGMPAVDDDSIWDWSPGTLLQDSTVANPFTLEVTGPQSYILDVVGANGCVASDTINIGITPLLDIPTGFSPNEDGMNDAWTLGFLSFYPNVVVQIYNRWGDLLVESAPGYPEPWDGTYQGDPLPIGTYYYVIRVNEPEFPDPLTGPVTILR